MKRTVLITRPEEDALPLAETLRARDLRVLIEPMLRIKPVRDVAVDLEGVQALMFSSSNGVRAFAALNKSRDLPVFTTGEASARVARNLGFKNVEGADGDVNGLVRLVRHRLKPGDGALFHGAGSVVAGDLATQLGKLGYTLRREVIYEAVQADELSPQLLQKFEAGEIDIVLLFSPRTVETFLTLLKASSADRPALADALSKVTALCMSRAVADAARQATWRDIEVAERPELNAMLSLIERTVTALDEQSPSAAEGPSVAEGPAAAAPMVGRPLPGEGPTVRTSAAGAAPRQRRSRWAWIAAAAVLLFVALAGLATIPAWRTWKGSSDQPLVTEAPSTEPAASDEPATTDEAASEAPAADEPVPDTAEEPAAAATGEGETAGTEPSAEETAADATAEQAEPASAEPAADEAATNETSAQAEPATADSDATEAQTGTTEPATADGAGATVTATPSVADTQIDELAARLAAIEAGLADTAASAAAPADETVAALEQRIAALEAGGGSPAVADELAALSERITTIEQLLIDFMTEVPAESLADVKTEVQRLIDENEGLRNQLATLTERFEQADSTAFMLAVGRLGVALNAGHPFEAELATLQKLAALDPALASAKPALDTLAPHAADGAPSEIALTARFPDVALAIVQAAQQEGIGAQTEEAGWFDRLIGRISELVTVRPVGEDVEGDGPAARVARAEARLAVGDLASAVNELDQLTGAPAEAAAAWLAAAKSRLAVVPAFEALDALALERLGTGAGTGADDAAATGSGG
jgi:uroporphyrinogen-III synthase